MSHIEKLLALGFTITFGTKDGRIEARIVKVGEHEFKGYGDTHTNAVIAGFELAVSQYERDLQQAADKLKGLGK